MIIDLQDDGSPTEFECDVAIVGAGAVGIVSAVELSRKGLDVLLLEGGGAGLEVSSQDLYKGYSAGLNLTGMTAGRYRMLGGSTNFWGGQISRFESVVFGDRDWVDAPQWPLSRAELDAYYDRVATLIGLPADFTDEQLWARVGATAAPTLDEGLDVFLTRTLVNRSMAHVFRSELEGEKVRTVLHANATGLVGGEGGRLTGVRVATLGGKIANVKARRVVLACGTIEIARMLQLPLADGSAAPWASNPWLGKGYLDHIEVIAGKVKVLGITSAERAPNLSQVPAIAETVKGYEALSFLALMAPLRTPTATVERINAIVTASFQTPEVKPKLAALGVEFVPMTPKQLDDFIHEERRKWGGLIRERGLKAVAISLDDFYLGREARTWLAGKAHRLLQVRGPPGTHDVALACAVLDHLRGDGATPLPAFDKSTDERRPKSAWRQVEGPADVVILEGWCVGARPEPSDRLMAHLNTLERRDDPTRAWRGYVNRQLSESYQALWGRLDRLVMLQPPGFEVVKGWRTEQEAKLRARTGRGMSDAEVGQFVQHYERITRWILEEMPARADWVVPLTADRTPIPQT